MKMKSSSDPQQRKRRRMQSNRESARRSRMRKQKHLDDLTAEIAQLWRENRQILKSINGVTQQCVRMEAHNSVVRAQMMELSQRLHSLNQILTHEFQFADCLLSTHHHHPHPIMAPAHMFHYY